MHIRWRELELPSRVRRDEAVSGERYGRFEIEPFEQGFGTTIGNSLRRVLLSSLEGAAVTVVKIAGVPHEFTSIDGVLEDVTDIVLNIKGIVIGYDGEEPKTITLRREGSGEARAGDCTLDPAITIINPEHVVATLTADVTFDVEMTVRSGRGYATAVENREGEPEVGVIPVDSIFSPVLRVRYRTEDMRVGHRTNFDRLIMEIWTDGSVAPEDALFEAGFILRKHLNALIMCPKLGEEVVAGAKPEPAEGSEESRGLSELLAKPITTLNLSVRASNCLEAARIMTVGGLVSLTVAELLRFRSFGRTSLHEVQRKLSEHGLALGMGCAEREISSAAAPSSDDGTLAGSQVGGVAPLGASVEPPGGSDAPATAGTGPMEVFTMED